MLFLPPSVGLAIELTGLCRYVLGVCGKCGVISLEVRLFEFESVDISGFLT